MGPDFVRARSALESKNRAHRDKRLDLPEAVADVSDGDHVALGGCLYSRTPMAALMELLRQRPEGITLSRSLMCYEGELFTVADSASTLVTSWLGGIGLPWGMSKLHRSYVIDGRVRFEEWSHLALVLRYRAGAMGVPFMPTMSMLGSDILSETDAQEMICPFTGKRIAVVPALFPDVALLHVQRADKYGNIQIDGYGHADVDIARAASKVIVTCEEIVDPEEIRIVGDQTALPHFVVDAVVEVPFGSYPHECYGEYDADFAHFDEYSAAIDSEGLDVAVRAYLDRHVYGVSGHEEFLMSFGKERLSAAKRRAKEVLL